MVRIVNQKTAHSILNKNTSFEQALIRQRRRSPEATSTTILLEDSLDRVRGYLMNIAEATIDHAIHRRTRQL